MMDKVRKPNISVCYTPSSEPYSIYYYYSFLFLFYFTHTYFVIRFWVAELACEWT
jgi:hypothetical protein